MGQNRFVYLLILVGAMLFYILYPFWFGWYLMVAALLFPLFDLLISLPGMLTRRVCLCAPYVLEQGEQGTLAVTTLSENPIPAGRIKARLHVNRDDLTIIHRFKYEGIRGGRYELAIDTSHSGVIRYELPLLWATSLMGLFSIPVSVQCKTGVLILPTPVKPPNTALLPQVGVLRPKPGGGFSEEHDLRPYRQGDPMNSVHWKLSAKHDTLIIREALIPETHSRLVCCAPWNTPGERDLIIGRLRWISAYLLKHECPHYVRLDDKGLIAEVTRPEDLTAFLHRSLDPMAPSAPDPITLPARFTWSFQVDAREGTQ